MNSTQILSLLSTKHKDDVFVPECKDGPSTYGGHLRLDAWAMPKSWSHLKFIGYEIKISRSDFLNDSKAHKYLDLCNEFYFVCPKGLIDASEVFEQAGLIEVSSTGTRLVTRKKAPYRTIQPPVNLLLYIIMCRSKIGSFFGESSSSSDSKQYWEEWLTNKQLNYLFGRNVSKSIKKEVDLKIKEVEDKNRILERRLETYSEVVSFLKEMGFKDGDSSWYIKSQLEQMQKQTNQGELISALKLVKSEIDRIINKL